MPGAAIESETGAYGNPQHEPQISAAPDRRGHLARGKGRGRVELRQLDALADPALDPEGQGACKRRLARPRAPHRAGGVTGTGSGKPGQANAAIPAPCRNREFRCGARRLSIPSPEFSGEVAGAGRLSVGGAKEHGHAGSQAELNPVAL